MTKLTKLILTATSTLILCAFTFFQNDISYDFQIEKGQDYIRRNKAQKIYFSSETIPQDKLHLSLSPSRIIYPQKNKDYFVVYYTGDEDSTTIRGKIKISDTKTVLLFEKKVAVK